MSANPDVPAAANRHDALLRALPAVRPDAAHAARVHARAASAFARAYGRPAWLAPVAELLEERIVPAAAVAFASMYLYWAAGQALP